MTLIGEAVFSRCLSALKSEREVASKYLPRPSTKFTGDKKQFLENVRQVSNSDVIKLLLKSF